MKQKSGRMIEGRGIGYTIRMPRTRRFFQISNQEEEDEEEEEEKGGKRQPFEEVGGDIEQVQGGRSVQRRRVRRILRNVNFRAREREIMAVMGPSGAGKSTLLEIVAGELEPDRSSSILIDNKLIDKARFKKMCGYVRQKETLFPFLTVRETLAFSAMLRLGVAGAELRRSVEELIQELGLRHIAESRIGDDDRIRGISGGEQRRVSIGVEVIHHPCVLILDEPTSGLDSTAALQIVRMLKTMAEAHGRTIVLSIHQPGFRIVKLFNSVLLLDDGTVLHHGTVEQLHAHLISAGLSPPDHVNIVEFAIDEIEALRDPRRLPSFSGRSESLTLQQLFHLSTAKDEQIKPTSDLPRSDFANSRFSETVILAHRFSKNVLRTKELFALRTFQMLVAGLVLGSIFYNLQDDLSGAESRAGLFAFILTFLLSCTTEALPIFLQEREILMKETSCGSYRVSSYAVANAFVFLPFLLILALCFSAPLYWLVGLNSSFPAFMYFLLLVWLILYTASSVVVFFSALVPNFIVGNSVISGVMGSFFLFSGYFISSNGIPSYWIFMHYLSLFRYPFEGFLVNEFAGAGKCLDDQNGVCLITGEDLLRREGIAVEHKWRNVVITVGFVVAYRLCSYLVIRCRCRCRSR